MGRLRLLAALLVLAVAGSVRAGPGDGIRMGGSSARLHPYLELEGRWDSNVAYSPEGHKQSGYIFHVRPGLRLDSPSDSAAVQLDASADWAQYSEPNKDLSRLYGQAMLGVGLNRRGEVSLEVNDSFQRSRETQVLVLGGAVISNLNRLDVSVPWRPGGGALVTTLSGGWTLQSFEPYVTGRVCVAPTPQCDSSLVSQLNYSDVSGRGEVRWRFLPHTAAIAGGEYWKRLPQDEVVGGRASGWRATGGLAGLVTEHVAATVKGGWSSTSATASDTASWYGNVEGEWFPTETTDVKLGYLHDTGADPGVGGGWAGHRVYLDGHALLAARYTVALTFEYEHRDYGGSPYVRGTDLLSATPSVDVELGRWLRGGVGFIYTKRTSSQPGGAPALPGYNFDKSEVFVRVRGTY